MPLGMEVGLGPGDIVRWGPISLQRGTAAPNFRPMSVVAKRSPISATAEHLFAFSFFITMFLLGSVRQIKLAIRQLLDGR